MPNKIAYFTNIAPHYRDRLWQLLASEGEFEFHFFFGQTSQKGIKEINFNSPEWEPFKNRIHLVKNYRIRDLLVWQKGVIKEVFLNKWDIYIFLGDMFILSTWISTIIAKFMKRRVFYWSHGIYGKENFLKLLFRKSFLRLADKHFLYGNYAKGLMTEAGFDESKLYVIYNSLDYDKHLQLRNEVVDKEFYRLKHFFENHNLPILIFIGRLTPEKKLELLIQVVKELNEREDCVNLILVGDGSIKSSFANFSEELKRTFKLYGPCYEEKEIGRLLANATLCVSPGNIGLTAIHSLSFGTPVITHNNFSNQMPEFEVIENEITGAFFEENSVESMKETIRDWLDKHPNKEISLINACYEKIDNYYNPYCQLQVFKHALS